MLCINPKRGVALITVLFIMSLFILIAVQMKTQSRIQSKLTSFHRVQVNYRIAAENALIAAQASLEQHFVAVNNMISTSSDFDHSSSNFGLLLSNPVSDQWEQRFGVDYKTYGQSDLPGLSEITTNTWGASVNNGRMVIPVRIFVKNNLDDPASAIAGNSISFGPGNPTDITKNTDVDGKIIITAIAFGVHNDQEPMAILSAIIAPSPNYEIQGRSRNEDAAGGQDSGNTGSIN